jgi:hypothetical protein
MAVSANGSLALVTRSRSITMGRTMHVAGFRLPDRTLALLCRLQIPTYQGFRLLLDQSVRRHPLECVGGDGSGYTYGYPAHSRYVARPSRLDHLFRRDLHAHPLPARRPVTCLESAQQCAAISGAKRCCPARIRPRCCLLRVPDSLLAKADRCRTVPGMILVKPDRRVS